MERLERNIWRYQFFEVVAFTPVMLPVIVLFWKENGLDLLDIYLLQGIYAVFVVFLEVPTGMVADRLGKRASLIAAMFLMTVGMVVYAPGTSFAFFLVGELLLALGSALLSGADSALLYDTLKALGRQEEYQQIEGKARSWQLVSFAVCNIIGGLVGSYSYRLTFWLSALGPLIAFFLALSLFEAPPPRQSPRGKGDLAGTGEPCAGSFGALIRASLKFVWKHRLVRWQTLFFAVLLASSTWLLWLYQPYMKWSGLPVAAFGVAFAAFNLFAAGMSRLAHRFERILGRQGTLVALMSLQVLPLILMALVVTPLSFLFILGHQAVRSIGRIVISDRILRYTYADKRATVLSLGALIGRLFFAVTAPLVGYVARQATMPCSLLFQAALISVLFAALLLTYRRIPAKYFTVKESVNSQQ